MTDLEESFNYSQTGLASTFRYLAEHIATDSTGHRGSASSCLGRQPGERAVPANRQIQIANIAYSQEARAGTQAISAMAILLVEMVGASAGAA